MPNSKRLGYESSKFLLEWIDSWKIKRMLVDLTRLRLRLAMSQNTLQPSDTSFSMTVNTQNNNHMNSDPSTSTGKDEERAQPERQQDTEDSTPPGALWCRRKWLLLVGMAAFALMLGGLGGVIGGFIVRATVKDNDEDDSVVQPGNDITRAGLLEFLEPHSPDGALLDPTSPQSQALEWLLQDLTSPGAVVATDQSMLQRYALATLYYSTKGDGWTKREEYGCCGGDCECEGTEDDSGWPWLTLDHECMWDGISCNFDDSISSIMLPMIHMSGPIPAEISLLFALANLFLGTNQLSSSIPSELGLLTRLHTLDWRENHLTGVIPTELGRLTRLSELNLAHNKLTGSIPTEFGLLTSMERMDLKDNMLNGDIPSELGMMQHASKCFYPFRRSYGF